MIFHHTPLITQVTTRGRPLESLEKLLSLLQMSHLTGSHQVHIYQALSHLLQKMYLRNSQMLSHFLRGLLLVSFADMFEPTKGNRSFTWHSISSMRIECRPLIPVTCLTSYRVLYWFCGGFIHTYSPKLYVSSGRGVVSMPCTWIQ